MFSEDSKLTRPMLEPGSDSVKENLVCSFDLSFHVFESEGHVFPPERGEMGGREGVWKVQPVHNFKDLEGSRGLNTGVAKAVSAASRLSWAVFSVNVTGLALTFV